MADFSIVTAQFSLSNIAVIAFRIVLATIFSGTLGLLSGKKGRAAGFKTHILVCLGATTAMLTNQYIFTYVTGPTGDPTRIAAQVISGIGFIGAGTIIVTGKQQIKGVTTAAGLWACACLGLAIGIGFYSGALISWIFIISTLTIFHKYESKLYLKIVPHELYIEVTSLKEVSTIINNCKASGCILHNIDLHKSKVAGEKIISLFITLSFPSDLDEDHIINTLRLNPGINYIELL